MARHDQRGKESTFVCTHCQESRCSECVDILRVIYTNQMICKCKRTEHTGEPVDQQIQDPETGTIYTPGLTVSRDGEVKREGQGTKGASRE